MNRATLAVLAGGVLCLGVAGHAQPAAKRTPAPALPAALKPAPIRPAVIKPVAAHTQDLNPVIKRYCAGCHSENGKAGGLSLVAFDVTRAAQNAEVSEKAIR